MRQIILLFIAVVAGVLSLCYYSYEYGRKSAQEEIINRAKNSSDIEIIIFGESQL